MSSTPATSPAAIILQYRRSKALGWRAMASESGRPARYIFLHGIEHVLEWSGLLLLMKNLQGPQNG